MRLIYGNSLDAAIFGYHLRSRSSIHIPSDGFVLGLLLDWRNLEVSQLLQGLHLLVPADEEWLIFHQLSGVDAFQKAPKVDVIIIFRNLSNGQW